MRRYANYLFLIIILFSLAACDEQYVPKPRGFFRIKLPEKSYKHFQPETCPFEFDIPVYAEVTKDSSQNAEPCFLNVDFNSFNATVYLSYKTVKGDLPKLIEDHRNMTMKHIPKASGINEDLYNDAANKIYGSYYAVKGSAASNVQFYLTDSISNFIRGSLYFNNVPQPDSIGPVLDFITSDVKHLVETFKWK